MFNLYPLTVTQVSATQWSIDREVTFAVGGKDSDDVITVPENFITDFASVPWPASMLIPLSGQHNMAAVVHDFLYSIVGWKKLPYNMKDRTRKECDLIFLEALRACGCSWLKSQIMYRAVRIGAAIPWKLHKKRVLAALTGDPRDKE